MSIFGTMKIWENNWKRLLVGLLALGCHQVLNGQQNIRDFGALGDGETLNTQAIQAAIDQAHDQGGGQVTIPKGRFLSGTILLKSNVELHLEKGAVLLGSTNPANYLKLKRWKALVMADEAENIAITGKGIIDGQGAELALQVDSLFYAGEIDSAQYELANKRPIAPLRPQLIEFVECKNIRVTGIELHNASSWVQSYDLCENLVIDGIRVKSDTYWNNDGIDVTDSKHVRITNCYINASDDGICLKSYRIDRKNLCDSVYIAHCTVRSSASAVKFGTASYNGFRNVVVEDIKVFDTFRSAIALEVVDGGLLENVIIRNIRAKNTGNAIFIRLGEKNRKYPVGTLRNVLIQDVKVEVPAGRPDENYLLQGPALPFFHNVFPASIAGIPGHPVQNVTLENIEIIYPGGGNKAYAYAPISRLDLIPEQKHLYPEFSMFGELPAWGLYVRHAEGITLRDFRVRIRKPDYRPAFVFDDVKGLKLEEIEIKGDAKDRKIVKQAVVE